MKISVIIPVLNGERYIAQCLDNVLCQTHRDLEIIVIDDGSTDSTAAIAARYPSVKVISQPNGGISVARNNGIAVATGDYIHFLDVDDLLNREFYERMVAAIGSNTGAGPVDMVYGSYVNGILPDTSIQYTDRLLLTLLDDKIRFTNSGASGYAWRYLIRRAFIEENGLRFEPGKLIEDVPFTLQALALSAAVVTAPGATYHYMKRAGSIINTRNKEQARRLETDHNAMRAWRREFYDRHGLGPVIQTRSRAIYKLLGIPLWTRVERNDGKTRWYLLGVRILQRRVKT